MIVDNALANLKAHWVSRCGGTGKRRAEHRSFWWLRPLNLYETSPKH
jgi:hypothetical protein